VSDPLDPRSSALERAAEWLLEELERRGGELAEETAAIELVRLFGGDVRDLAPDGRSTVAQHVRNALERAATAWPRELVWDAPARIWRLRDRPPPYR
jgi:hypothetical protein